MCSFDAISISRVIQVLGDCDRSECRIVDELFVRFTCNQCDCIGTTGYIDNILSVDGVVDTRSQCITFQRLDDRLRQLVK